MSNECYQGIADSHWLTPWERKRVIEEMLYYELIEYSNSRNLPLKMGGKTDIYIKLRDARNDPNAIDFVANTYANPLLRLNPECFIEVPDAVSCFAGPLSIMTGIPYLTIREQAKEGRVAKAKVIGKARRGSWACTLDDVITNGDSKVAPYTEASALGLQMLPQIVLVDRQQGWEETFRKKNIPPDIWSGMTLHHIRRHLVENGIMARCDPALEAKNPLILALDKKNWKEFLPFLDVMRTSGCILKVNDMLFNMGIMNLIPDLMVYGRVMADLKGHDIPNTLENISRHFLQPGCQPWAVTVHASGGIDMIRAVVKILEGTPTKVLAVTVLTSINKETCEEVYHSLPIDEVRTLAKIADEAGAHGLVCSAHETKEMRDRYPNATLVIPGTRSPGADQGDQKRVGTPAAAYEDGGKQNVYLVAGRQVNGAADPVAEVNRVMKDELNL